MTTSLLRPWRFSRKILLAGCIVMFVVTGRPTRSSLGAEQVPGIRPVTCSCPAQGFLSLGVFDSSGKLIRSLAYARPTSGGRETLSWDATTDLGVPAVAGTYQVRGVWFPQRPRVEYRMKVGLSGDPPYPLPGGLGGWGGNLGAPMDVACNGRDLVAVFACVESSLETGVQRMDAQGKIIARYQTFFPWDVRLACTVDRENLYLAVAQLGAKRLAIGKYDLESPRGKILADIPAGEHEDPAGRWKGRWTTDVRGLAIAEGRLYVPVRLDDKLFVVDARDGKILNTVGIPSPRGVAAGGGRNYLLSGTRLLELDHGGSPIRTIVESGLDDPSGLALDVDGTIYVSDGGGAQQVKVFSADGRLLRTIGKPGGRPRNGPYDPLGLLDPRGLCLGPDGNLWVASSNEDFQRLSVWSKTGELRQEFFNIRISSGQGMLTPDRSEMLVLWGSYADSPGVTAYRVDWSKHTWYPSWHLDMPIDQMRQDGVLRGNAHIYDQLAKSFDGRAPYLGFTEGMVRAANGRTYLVGGDFSIWRFDPATKQVHPAALLYTHRVHRADDGKLEGDYDQGPNNWLAWSDTNADGRMDVDELRLSENHPLLKGTSRLFGWQLQPDLSVLLLAPERNETDRAALPRWVIFRLKPRQVLNSGVPQYDWADLEKVTELKVPDFTGGDGTKPVRSLFLHNFRVIDGRVYVTAEPGTSGRLRLSGVDGDGWWASRNWRLTPLVFDLATGEPAWLKLGRRAPGRALPGEMYYPGFPIAGREDGAVFVPDALGQVWAWTDTGLYLGPLYNEFSEGKVDANAILVELVGAHVYSCGGKLYACTGDHGVNVHEVMLPKRTPIDAGSVTVTSAMANAARPWDPDGPPPGKKPLYVAHSLCDPETRRPLRTITPDGRLEAAEWQGVAPMKIEMDGVTVADVRVTFDEQNLYLAYEVKEPNGLRNAGSELPLCPFASGSYVDFSIAPDLSQPERQANTAGDVRVILARITGGQTSDYQMGFWPVKKDGRHPQVIQSPAQERRFDDVAPVPGLTFGYQIAAEGYTLEAKVPFGPLGFHPGRNGLVGFDLSIGFADSAGQIRRRAAHWAGQSETAVVDRPGSAELKPATWGLLQLDRMRPIR